MKKIVCMALALLMLLSAALAEPVEEEESAALTKEELEIYLDSLGAAALEDENVTVTALAQGGAEVRMNDTVLLISDETLTESTAILSAWLGEDQADLRGLYLGSALDEVLRAYPNDNPILGGSYYDAVLFIDGEKPEMKAGYLLRDGQRVQTVIYEVFSWQEDGVAVSSVVYQLENSCVTAVRFALDDEILEEEEALGIIQEIADMQETAGYFAYPSSAEDGESLAPFEREDLSLVLYGETVADLLDLTAEGAVAAFGPQQVDEWSQDSNGESLRLMQWEGLSLLLVYDAQKNFLRTDSLTVNDDVVDGPRGVRVGDPMDSVIFRFRHGDTFVDGSTLALYGDGQQPPYGILNYSPESAELSYSFVLEDGRTVIWHMTFIAGILQTMTLALR